MSPLAKSIYHTLAFFDAQDMPLTLLEIKEYLVSPLPQSLPLGEGKIINFPSLDGRGKGRVNIGKIRDAIEIDLKQIVNHDSGFYFLTGRSSLVHERKKKYRISLKNFRKAKKYLRPLGFFPYLRAVAVSGSLALLNSTQNSDIDLFIITKKNRIWLTRFLVSLYFQLLGVRRYGTKIKERFCLNHYVREGLTLQMDRNLYTAGIYTSLIPVLGRDNLEKFWRQNQWIKEFISFAPSPFPSHEGRGIREGNSSPLVGEVRRGEVLAKIFEFFLEITLLAPLLNYLSGLYQKRRIRRQEYILVSNSELSFHPGSRGQKVLAKFRTKIALDKEVF